MERPTFICNSSQITLLSDPIKFNMLKLQRNVGDPKGLDWIKENFSNPSPCFFC